jgi:hypothetical protein
MFLLIIFNVNKPESLENSVVFLSKKAKYDHMKTSFK